MPVLLEITELHELEVSSFDVVNSLLTLADGFSCLAILNGIAPDAYLSGLIKMVLS